MMKLRSIGAKQHNYAIVFGHGLDGLMWSLLRREGLLPSSALSIERPFWNGAFWATYPERQAAAGVNEYPRGAQTLVTVWSEALGSQLQPVVDKWRLSDPSMPSVPAVQPDPGDSLHEACLAIAQSAATGVKKLVDQLQQDGFAALPAEQLMVVAGHEFIWDVSELLSQTGQLHQPEVLASGSAPIAGVEALAFVRPEPLPNAQPNRPHDGGESSQRAL